MKISAQEEYGLRCLVQLAALRENKFLTLPQLAEREGISSANAGKLMWLLSKSGFVRATRGAKGGYRLAKPSNKIYLNEVIKVLDDDKIKRHCENYTGVKDSCVHKGDCGIRPVIVGLHKIVHNALSNITLAQLVGTEKKVDERFHRIQGLQASLNNLRCVR